mmetsp:Transcript_9845/g.21278  ORF Transcript_9845/g.21278 Transcript_9845/m.21278 type:complete len:275 (+) Transcript_9845:38-862(+)
MATSTSINGNYNDDSAIPEAEISDLDDFDFILDKDGADGDCLFDVSFDEDFGGVIEDLIGSAEMDFEFETLECCDADEEKEDKTHFPTCSVDCHSHPSECDRSPSPCPHEHQQQQFQTNMVNVDPPSQQQHITHPRRVSESDISMCSMQSYSTPSTNQQASEPAITDIQYSEALQNLAESMKRSEMTRCHVRMHCSMLGPEHQRALYQAKVRLNQLTQQVQQLNQQQQIQQHQSSSPMTTSFFNGSSQGSFANKMEQSRKKISMYMAQVNRNTL